jgi:serum/glucocorticoid-regulated kinase 2
MCITSAIYVRTASRIERHVLIPCAAPYIPPIDPSNASDTQNFDETFLDMEPVINDENDMDTDQEREREQTDLEPTDGEDSVATPSQSRSSSAHPLDDLVDVFDGYSFKGRNSVIIDDEEEASEEEEEEEEENVTVPSILAELNGESAAATVVLGHEEPMSEPKTPEARPTALPLPSTPPAKRSPVSTRPELPPVDTTAKPASFTDATPRASEDAPAPAPTVPVSPVKAVAHAAAAAAAASTGPDIHHKELKKASAAKSHGQRSNRQRNRREKSGVPALDRDLSDANEEDDVRTERDDDDDDWDFIEADGEDRNGARGTSLFARGVVDRYRLAVFRKGSTPNRTTATINDAAARLSAVVTNGSSSPNSPTTKDRRGRTAALPSFRRKTFLRAKSPPSTSTRSSGQSAGKSFTTMSERSVSATVSTVSSPQSARTTLGQPSLKSKESVVSVGSPGSSSGASTNGEGRPASDADIVETVRAPHAEEHEKYKNKKLKRGAEKVLSLFALP